MRPMRTIPYRGLVTRLDPPWFRFTEVHQGVDTHWLGTHNFALKITGKVLYSRRASHHVVVSSQGG